MRIHFRLKSDNRVIPFDHQSLLVGTIHKWLGWNNVHGKVSLFSFSRLGGGEKNKDGLIFRNNTTFFFSAYDNDLLKKLIAGVQKDPLMFYGLSVNEIFIEDNPDFTGQNYFQVGSPILIKRRINNSIEHILYNNLQAGEYLKETLNTRMKLVGLDDSSLDIQFDLNYIGAGRKRVKYNAISNITSWCPVIIKGKPETKLFAWNVGLGNSTGIGFGAIK
ncbi:MAG: CRISPR-associated endoribonuclease Cas6 [Bacteroidales bacterium]